MEAYLKIKIESCLSYFNGTKAEKLSALRACVDELIAEEKKEADRKKKQEELNKELENLYSNLQADWNRNPRKYKIKTNTSFGVTTFHYIFDNGDKFSIDDNGIIMFEDDTHRGKYTVGLSFKQKFIDLVNKMTQEANTKTSNDNDWFEKWQKYYSHNSSDAEDFFQKWKEKKASNSGSTGSTSGTNTKEPRYKNPFSTKGDRSIYRLHPKWSLYQTLIITVASRTEHLNNLPNNSDDRNTLENELNVAIDRVKEMILKYHFD